MKIVMSFNGGCFDGKVTAADSNDQTPAAMEVVMLYLRSHHGEVGCQFSLPASVGQDVYEVTERLERYASVIVRARHVGHAMHSAELMELLR